MKKIACTALGLFFIAAGTLHFVKSATYVRIVPPSFPYPQLLVAISGACEILGGVGVLIAASRKIAGFGLVALLLAVFPANVWMAMHPERYADMAARWLLWWRLPLQAVLIAWVWFAALSPRRDTTGAP